MCSALKHCMEAWVCLKNKGGTQLVDQSQTGLETACFRSTLDFPNVLTHISDMGVRGTVVQGSGPGGGVSKNLNDSNVAAPSKLAPIAPPASSSRRRSNNWACR